MNGREKLGQANAQELGEVLLRAGQAEQPDARALERTLAAISIGAVGALGAASTAKAATELGAALTNGAVRNASLLGSAGANAALSVAKSSVLLTTAKWFLATAVLGGVTAGGVRLISTQLQPTEPSASVAWVPASIPATSIHDPVAAAPVNPAPGFSRAAERADEALDVERGSSKARVQDVIPQRARPQRSAEGATPNQASFEQGPAPSGASLVATRADERQLLPGPEPSARAASSVEWGAGSDSPGAAPRVQASPPPALALEVRSIDAARQRLEAGEPEATLRLLVQHQQRFGRGALGPEVLFLRMQAEQALGQRTAAKQTARLILERFPKSPAAARAQELASQ
jgi:hypothetical protein